MVSFIRLLWPPPSPISQRAGPKSSINVLPDDVLLEVFDFCRLENIFAWNHERWYKLVHTCRRWRHIIFSSPSRLDLQLSCTYGTPVADMLSHSPPLPLIVDYSGQRPLPTNDEEGALLALQNHDRVRQIHLYASIVSLDKLLAVMDRPFPVLEELSLRRAIENPDANEDEVDEDDEINSPRLPQAFQASQLRHLSLVRVGDVIEVGLPHLTSFSGLVSLFLLGIPFSAYLSLEYLASSLSFMPQLEHLGLQFTFSAPSYDISGELINVPNAKPITLPNLSEIFFEGESSYLEGLAARISAPLLTSFCVTFFEEPSSTLSHLSRLLSEAAELRLPVASIKFSGPRIYHTSAIMCMADTLDLDPDITPPFQLVFRCAWLNVQVAAAGQICTAFTPILSAVETLLLDLDDGGRFQIGTVSIEDAWHDLLRPFCNVETLLVGAHLTRDMTRALWPDNSGQSMAILPQLCELARPDYAHFGDAFDQLIAARRDAGQHIIKSQRSPTPNSDSEEEDDDEDESDSDSEEDKEEEGRVKLAVEGQREGKGSDPDTDTDKKDPDSGTNDNLEISTALDSDSDFDFE